MASPENPYQPPQTIEPTYEAQLVDEGGLWRKGKLLVMHKLAELPDRCVKSNAPAAGRLKRELYWHHPAVFAALLLIFLAGILGVLAYVVISIATRKKATIYVGLSRRCIARRRRAILWGWLTVLASVPLFALGFLGLGSRPNAGWLIMAGTAILLAGIITTLLRSRMVWPVRIDDQYVWLRGVHPDFLAPLPEWPHSP